jgi:hypothetical protein
VLKTLIVVAATLLSVLVCNEARADTYYPIACRGPLNYSFEHVARERGRQLTALVVDINPALSGAGSRLERLPAGTCAWLDRALNSSEPRKLKISVIYWGTEANEVLPAAAMINCAADSNCVLVVYGASYSGAGGGTVVGPPRSLIVALSESLRIIHLSGGPPPELAPSTEGAVIVDTPPAH